MSLPRVGLVESVMDKRLLGAGFTPWPGQIHLLETLEQGLERGVWLYVWNCGRRGGKSTLLSLAALWSCLLRDDLDELAGAAGRSFAAICSTNVTQARLVVSMARDLVEQSPLLGGMIESASLDALNFSNATSLVAFPASSRGLRGRALRFAAMDEAAHFVDAETGSAHEAAEIFAAMTPSIAQFAGRAAFVVSSTPAGSDGWFGQLVAQASAGEIEGAQAVTMTSADLNPSLSPEWLRAEQKRDPVGFESEYLAALTGGGGQFFPDDAIDAAVQGEYEVDPTQGTGWIAALDVGFTKDPLAAVVVGRAIDDPRRLLLGCARRWRPPKRAPETATERRALQDEVLGEVAALFAHYGARTCISDGYAMPVVRENLRGVFMEQLTLTASAKLMIFGALRSRLTSGTLALYRNAQLLDELRRLRTGYRNGALTALMPRSSSGHYDLLVALAMAVHLLDKDGPVGRLQPRVSENGRGEPRRSVTADLMNRIF